MTERMRFVSELLAGERDMTELCLLYDISRKTGYKWRERFCEGGKAALADRSHARHDQAHATEDAVVQRLIGLRCEHPTWGPRKLVAYLLQREGPGPWPAPSTVGDILRRHGLVNRRRRRRTILPRMPSSLIEPQQPNDLWCTDFKGQFRTGDGHYCYPLTLTDAASRYVLMCRGLCTPSTALAKPWFEQAFRQHGLPWAMRSDNGPPFGSRGVGGLSQLSIWWIKLGIVPEYIEPGCPQQNGRHERMHRTLKQEVTRPVAANLRCQQHQLDRFVEEFNTQRPHEALAQRPPGDLYRPSQRSYPSKLAPIEYPSHYEVRQVRQSGEIKFGGNFVYVGQTLCHEPIGLVQIDNDIWELYFAMRALGRLDSYRMKLYPFGTGRKSG